jgi:glycosyltransferase involved in cell wall biosynthesis
VRLAPLLDKIGLDLYMAGDIDMAALSREGAYVPDNIRLLGRISDDDFAKALTGALCFLFPSRIEGFGLPAVEAMALGCPVVASTAPCLPEVCGDAALYADPDDTNAWLGAIARLKEDGELRQQIVDLGHTRAATYSWRASAERYLELMAEVDADCGLGHGER